MSQHIFQRVVQIIPTLIIASIAVFIVMRLLPGDPARLVILGPEGEGIIPPEQLQAVRAELGLDEPILVQYANWMGDIVTLDGGQSLESKRPVFAEIWRRMPVTIELALITFALVLLIGIPIGALSAAHHGSWLDRGLLLVTTAGLGTPVFLAGALIFLVLINVFHMAPSLTYVRFQDDPIQNLEQFIWPALALSTYYVAAVARLTRVSMLEVLRSDFLRTARAKGLPERVVILRHALKASLVPVISYLGLVLIGTLSGSVVAEALFNLPGIGKWLFDSVLLRDYPVVQTMLFTYAVIVVIVNLMVDFTVTMMDPRLRHGER